MPSEQTVLRDGLDVRCLEDPWLHSWIDDPRDLEKVHDASLLMPEVAHWSSAVMSSSRKPPINPMLSMSGWGSS